MKLINFEIGTENEIKKNFWSVQGLPARWDPASIGKLHRNALNGFHLPKLDQNGHNYP